MNIIGLNMFHGDASVALVVDGQLVCAIAEERLNRKKHFGGFPALALQQALRIGNLKPEEVDYVAVGFDKSKNLGRKVAYVLQHPLKLYNFITLRARQKRLATLPALFARAVGAEESRLKFQIQWVEHHLAHVSSGYFVSDYDSCAGYSYDGSGDFVSAMMARCQGTRIEILDRVFLPHSLGTYYSTICRFIGYREFGDEGKVMGLAPYGGNEFENFFRDALAFENGRYRLNPKYFAFIGSDTGYRIDEDGTVHLTATFTPALEELFGRPREPGTEISQRDMNLAFGMQRRFEEALLHSLQVLHSRVPTDRIALAGGCALNSVANGRLLLETPFTHTWIQPAAGDEGLAVGAAYYLYHQVLGHPRGYVMKNAFLGPEYSRSEIKKALDERRLRARELEREPLLQATAQSIFEGKVTGWFQGRMEWGPRALGNRSILAHPGRADMKEILNARIKRREWFRPFAPSILADCQNEYFEQSHPSPFMLHVYKIRPEKRRELCAVNHVDNTGRLQTVTREENPLYYDLIQEFRRLSGIPVVLNTSFNENEPIVNRPEEAIDCFLRSRMDTLAIGNFFVTKSENPEYVLPEEQI